MPLFLYNTLSKKKEQFEPLNKKEVRMYVCGVTPYDEAHLGHGRAYVTFDIVRRHLENLGFKVKYIQNVTDIDDKLIKKSKEQGIGVSEIAEKYFDSYQKDMQQLNVLPPTQYIKATEHITEMVAWIKGLIEKGYAYQLGSDVYFEVRKFKAYGKLSNKNIDDLEKGARVEINKEKKDPLDFALWKGAKEGEPSWESPWGSGRPGWHIECSVMSTKYLGESFDIHGGGLDLIFPHHENEIAQTEALTCRPWVKYWLHNGFVNVDNQKMSKSLGNFFTLKDIFKKFKPEVVRFFLLSTHYRSPINFADQQLHDAEKALKRIYDTIGRLRFEIENIKKNKEGHGLDKELLELGENFYEAMNDDFNTAAAIGAIFEVVSFANRIIDEKLNDKGILGKAKKSLITLLGALGFEKRDETLHGGQGREMGDEIEKLIQERNEARKNKDFKRSDEIRDLLKTKGIILEDTPKGTRWIKKN
ncbi:cysteine--tRNA ligase [Candidatus Margulisiibacteriota bacterium]